MLEGPEFRFAIANESYREIIGKTEIIGKKVIDIIPEIAEQVYIDILRKVYATGKLYIGYKEPVWINKSAKNAQKDYTFNMSFQPLFDEQGNVFSIFIEVIDLTEQLAYQQKLEESLKEKETLLAEIHHRVKNNLAIVSGMLELQSMGSSNPLLKHALSAGQQRIRTIALVHELLYQSESLSQIDFDQNIRRLLDSLHEMYGGHKQISVNLQSSPVALNINQAIPGALIIYEVVTNAYKHAFKGHEQGTIDVNIDEEDNEIRIKISDDGVGLPKDLDIEGSNSLGMTLTNLLKQQLEADLEYTNHVGTTFSLKFRKHQKKGPACTLVE